MPDERTEKPTPRKLQKARQQGNVPRSREILSAMTFLVVIVLLRFLYNNVLVVLTNVMILWRDLSMSSYVYPEETIYAAWKPIVGLWIWIVIFMGIAIFILFLIIIIN